MSCLLDLAWVAPATVPPVCCSSNHLVTSLLTNEVYAQCQRSEVCGGVEHRHYALTICAVDISSTAVAGQVSCDTSETGRTFVFVPVDPFTTFTASSAIAISATVTTIIIAVSTVPIAISIIRTIMTRWSRWYAPADGTHLPKESSEPDLLLVFQGCIYNHCDDVHRDYILHSGYSTCFPAVPISQSVFDLFPSV